MKEVKRLCPSIYLLAVVVVTVSADALQGQLFNHRLHKRQGESQSLSLIIHSLSLSPQLVSIHSISVAAGT